MAVKGTECLKGTCCAVETSLTRCLQRHLIRLKHEEVAELIGMLQFNCVELDVVYSHSDAHLRVPKNHPVEGKGRIASNEEDSIVILKNRL